MLAWLKTKYSEIVKPPHVVARNKVAALGLDEEIQDKNLRLSDIWLRCPEINQSELALALGYQVAKGIVEFSIAVFDETGKTQLGQFKKLQDIPNHLPDPVDPNTLHAIQTKNLVAFYRFPRLEGGLRGASLPIPPL